MTEILTHANLSDMPDTGGTNTDHDARYYTETEVDAAFLKLDCSNDPLTGTLDSQSFLPTSFSWSEGFEDGDYTSNKVWSFASYGN